jgi:CRISPR-associated protein Cas1
MSHRRLKKTITQALPDRAKPARAGLDARHHPGAAPAPPEYLPARMVNEYVYCPRLFFYEWVEGIFAHSADTIEGAHRHKRVDADADPLPAAGDESAPPVVARSVTLSSDAHGVIAKIDLVEASGGAATPVDHKKGSPKSGDDGPEAWPADRVQVGVQVLVLREHGYRCDEAILYYHTTKQRVRVPATDELVAETVGAIGAARRTAAAGIMPPPLEDSPKCPRCSLVGICLPDETALARARRFDDDDPLQPWLISPDEAGRWVTSDQATTTDADEDEEGEAPGRVRRLVPSRDDLRPLYVLGQGLTVGKSGEVLRVTNRDRKVVQEARLHEISQVNLFGNITLTAPALQTLCGADKSVAHFSSGGWFYGLTQGLGLRNGYLRAEQFRQSSNPVFCRAVAARTVAAKIRNQRTLLQRNHVEPPRLALARLKRLADDASRTASLGSLLGIEGTAARLYFEYFGGMLKVDDEARLPVFEFAHRNRRPPRDPVNALLSLAYSLLSKDLTIVCAMVGFDPFWGFYHQPRFGRPALALDLMEMFRPLVADSSVLSAVNTGMVGAKDFVRVGQSVTLTPDGRKGLLRAYEQRVDGLVTHPVFGYRVSYRRVFEIQARLLARFVTGEIEDYPPFQTR